MRACRTLLLSCIALAAGCRTMAVRVEPALGVRLLCPSGWERKEAAKKVVVYSPSARDQSTRISVLVYPDAALPDGLETREAGLKAALGAKYRRERLGAATVAGRPGSLLEYSTLGPTIQRTIEYGREDGRKFYVFQFAAPAELWPGLQASFKEALESIAFFDIPKPPNESEAMVAMRDGARLFTYVVLPPRAGSPPVPLPALLIRSPYYSEYFEHSLDVFRPFTEQGYALVYQCVRGTGRSEGLLHPMSQEFADGQDAVRWIVKQPWSNGSVGTFGSSYDGFTALAAAVDTPEVKLVLADGAPIRAFETWPATQNGAIFASLLWWDRAAKGLKDVHEDPDFKRLVTNSRPVRDLDLAVFGEQDPVWRDTLRAMEGHSEYWDAWSLTNKLSRICAPVISMQAKNEFTSDCLDTFLALTQNACNQQVRAAHRFVLHSGGHGAAIYSPFASTPAGELIRSYLAKYLKGQSAVDASPVHYFIQNAEKWHTADRWPMTNKNATYYLDAQNSRLVNAPKNHPAHFAELAVEAPTNEAALSYSFDPASDDACDPKVFTERLAFESPKLNAPVEVVGRPELVLFVEIDTPDTDLFANIVDGAGNSVGQSVGVRLRFRDSMAKPVPMHPGEIAEVHLQFNATAFRFAAGAPILVAIKSTVCGLSENPNTGGSMTEETLTRPVNVKILTGPNHPSRLILPTLDK